MILVTNNEGTLGAPTTARMLANGAHGLDAIEAGIRIIEADPSVRTVGRGGWPNLLCQMELDACMMGRRCGLGPLALCRAICIRSVLRARSCSGCRMSCWWGKGRHALPSRLVLSRRIT